MSSEAALECLSPSVPERNNWIWKKNGLRVEAIGSCKTRNEKDWLLIRGKRTIIACSQFVETKTEFGGESLWISLLVTASESHAGATATMFRPGLGPCENIQSVAPIQ